MNELQLSRIRDLKFKQLLVFEKLLSLGSTYQASQALHISQPNIVKLLSQLEQLLEVPLFERHARGLTPTIYGERLAAYVKPMLGDARSMSTELQALRQGEQGKITIGTLISASAYLLPTSIAQLKQSYPLLSVQIQEASNEILFPKLINGELDLILGRLPEQLLAGISYYPLYHEQLVLVTRVGHPIQQASDHWANLTQYPWILPTQVSPVRRLVEQFFIQQGLKLPNNRVESLSLLTNVSLLQCSDSLSFMPRAAAQPFLKAGVLSVVTLEHLPTFGMIGYSLKQERPLSLSVQHFIQALQEVSQTLTHTIPG